MGIPEPVCLHLREFLTAMAENMYGSNDVNEEEDDCVIFKDRADDVRPATLSGRWKKICKALLSWFLPDLAPIYNRCHETLVKDLSASSCLEEDDRDFLYFYIQSSGNTRDRNKLYSRIFRLAFYTIPCLVSISAYHLFILDTARQQLPWSTMFLATIIHAAVLEALQEARSYKHRRKCRKVLLVYEDFIRRNEKITSMVKKCLRLIQETELISRGFTLVSQRNPLSRLEGGQKDVVARQCPVLRKLVFTVGREAVLLFREETKKLFDINPLRKELDIQGSYLAYEPIQSYGPCLQTDIEDTDTLHTITDGYSISALKGITHLLSLHQSEFIKALILVQHERFDKDMITSHVEELNIVESITARLEEWTVSLKKAHDYHSYAWMNREPVSKTYRTQSNVENIYVAIHSLDLHLQAALARVKCLSERIQSLPDTGLIDTNLDDFLDQMQPIKAELESCKGCWDEGVNRIEKVAGKSSSRVEESPRGDSLAAREQTHNAEIPAKSIEDYIIEDQVFEGYTDPDEVIGDYEWEKPLTAEEKEKKRREKEEALRMLSELKTVISVRAVETEKREKAAILKMYPGLRFPEKSCDTELTSQEESGRPCAHVATNQETFDGSCDHMSDMPSEEKKDNIKSDNDDEISNTNIETVSSSGVTQIDRLTNICIDSEDKNKEFLTEDKHTSLADELKQNESKETEGTSYFSHKTFESCYERDKHSVISSRGVRRLRKSDILDFSDSDLEEYPEDDSIDEQHSDEDEDEMPRLGLPLPTSSKEEDTEEGSDGVTKFRLPVLTLQERLEHFSGANLGLTSELAEKAVAKSKIMGVMEETTFGGDVYGECSSSNDDDDECYDNDVTNDDDDVHGGMKNFKET
ncbi:vezatin-like isoform X2 [Mercenaria mercenaria]|uniref:vezatin-like isoform X2 n=1 Tax=Mercenaria mercenaria TaxID=6596 RepID=UPI00234EEED2|nr:vezatin-like isoform X2 [Mercenaria mercenaria]